MPCRIMKIQSAKDPQFVEFFQHLSARDGGSGAGEVESSVREILARVRSEGDAALQDFTRRFDCPDMDLPFAVSPQELQLAAASIEPADLDIIAEAAAHIREFHEAEKERSWFMTRPDGTVLGQKVEAVDRAGLYVPGGKGGNTPLISSLLMTVVPAQVAGVREIAVVSPPREDGTINPYILAAAYLLDVNEVYRVGGPWAIGALAYGTPSIAAVDVIAGPGNIFVTMAKKVVQGQVGIDMLAGPSEILVLADDSARTEWLAADMLSQAEHDPLASAVCVTDSLTMADRLAAALLRRVADLPRADIAKASLRDWGAIIVVPNLDIGVEIANIIAPEHMEVVTADPWLIMPRVRHAGALFLGHNSAEPVGDYFAGPNHVLPTLGTARHSSALCVQTFCKKTSIIAASAEFTRRHAASIARLARLEGLEAHARSVEARIEI